ncbi:DUF4832 domain-containing protein [Flavobacterium dankookense]|uniref:Putative secreted protein (Por secretion system target) n=1 Tax=Flavobacterium dankookense TaxID=706186 RepID=A0A4R6Q8P4_9FLAO|nr:DUF4832 domain-containing protein [Flavobacterium dankookense]TDP58053.1 putative secreted protein (Por secretion system target) [Flavobacterium dankookense]
MKRVFTFIALFLLTLSANAQTTSVSYTESTENFSNPERGFYHHTETNSANYSPLTQSSLVNYRNNEKITLILRVFYLSDFLNTPISQSYLDNMRNDFNKIRNAGIKCVVRFAYSRQTTLGQRDASKAQMLSHIQQLTPLLQTNSDVIATMQAGFIGTWGEWYYTDHFGMNPTATDYANRKEIVDALLNVLPTNRTVQIRTPKLKQKLFNTSTAITQSQAMSTANIARVGHHNDCFLSDDTDVGTYTNTATEYPYLAQETKFLPMGGETCDFDPNRSNCDVGLTEMAQFHWSYMNIDYYPEVIQEFGENNCLNEIRKRLGYRFNLTSGLFPANATSGQPLSINIRLKNTGFASIYNDRKAYIVLRNVITNQEYSVVLASNPQLWYGSGEIVINENITLPSNMSQGNYDLFLNLPDEAVGLSNRPEFSIRFANNDVWESTTGYNKLNARVNVSQALSIADNNRINPVIYPIPANEEMMVEMENISDFKVTLFNTLGQNFGIVTNVVDNNKISINTQSLSDGVYMIRLENGNINATKRIIVKH